MSDSLGCRAKGRRQRQDAGLKPGATFTPLKRFLLLIALLLGFAAPGFSQAVTLSVPIFVYPTQSSDYNPTPGASSYTGIGGMVLNILTGTPPFTCALNSGSIPAGMTLSAVTPTSTPVGGCVLSGSPTTAGDVSFTLKVTDANSNTATSGTISFPVVTATPATYSAQACPTPTTTSVTCTWTSSVATSSQVCDSFGNAFVKGTPGASVTPESGCTTETDLTGTTSHSVALSGLAACTRYEVYFMGRGIVGGAPADYLFSWNDPGSGSFFFATACAASAGTADFSVQMNGPHNILQQGPMIVMFYTWDLVGVTDIQGHNVSFQITGIPTNSKVHWPDQQDNGAAIGTVSTTTTADDTLTLNANSDLGSGSASPFANAEQFEILTNQGGTTPVGSYTLTLTVKAGATPTTHTYTWAMNVSTSTFVPGTPATQPPIPSLSTWTGYLTSVGSGYYLTPGTPGGTPIICAFGNVGLGFYDGEWVMYQTGMYLGQSIPWVQAASQCDQRYANYQITGADTTWNAGAIYIFPHGLFYECKNFGTPTACSGVHALPHCCGGTQVANIIPYASGDYAREAAEMLEAKRLDYDLGGGTTTLAQVNAMAAYVLGILDQYANDDPTVLEESFMLGGLDVKAAIEYYLDPNTGNGDVRVPAAVQAVLDHWWNNFWVPWNGAAGGFPYELRTWTSLRQAGWGAIQEFGNGGASLEDLNNLIAPGYAWLYSATGQQKYQLEADTIFNSSVLEPTNIGIKFFGKTYTQGYRWTFEYLGWRGALTIPTTCFLLPQSGTCPKLNGPVPAVGSPTL